MRHVMGFLVGALIGAVGRFAVAFGWALAVWPTHTAVDNLIFGLVSGAIGVVVGGAGGVTCKPILGSLLAAALSGSSCYLALLPLGLGHGTPEAAYDWFWPALIGMIGVGAFAGGVGAMVGARKKPCSKCGQPASIWSSDSKGICTNCRAEARKKGSS